MGAVQSRADFCDKPEATLMLTSNIVNCETLVVRRVIRGIAQWVRHVIITGTCGQEYCLLCELQCAKEVCFLLFVKFYHRTTYSRTLRHTNRTDCYTSEYDFLG